ncbi:MAG: J domain-containing protein [Pseudomonadota bacterium]
MAADPYSLLGVSRTATEADIKKSYRKLAKELHPDANQDNPKASERFSEITRAYDVLGDKDKRAKFDRGEIDADGNPANPFAGGGFRGSAAGGPNPWGNQRGAGGAGGGYSAETGDFGSIFDDLFGGRSRRAPPPKGANVAYRLTVGFVEAATLAPQRITLSNGTSIDLKLPKGVETGTSMRLAGKGEAGPGGAGDATVSIEIRSHAFFRRDGADVRLDLPVTLAEAVTGAKVKVPTVDGPVMLGVPAGSSSGKILRLKGKGFTRKDGTRGDQLVSLLIDVPADDAALAAFAAQWSDARNVRAALGV